MRQIKKKDILLFYPYESMDPFLRLIKEASVNPDVMTIKITIYRLAKKARLVEYLCAAAENGKDVTEHFSYEGCILMCIESLLKQVPTRLIIETLEPAVIYLFPYDKMMQLTKQNWEINMFYRKILEYSLIVSQTKADSWRFESARERYNLLLETHPEIIKRAPLAHIASYLLMTPETLSRVRSGVL